MSTRVKPPSRTTRSLLRCNSLCSTPSAVEPKSQTLDARMQERDRTLEECRITKFKKFDMEKKDLFDHQTMGFISRKNKAPRNHWDPSFTRPTGAHPAISTLKARNTNLRPLREEGLSETPSQPTPLRNVVSHCCMENTSLLLVRTVLIREHTRSYIGAEILNHERSCRLNVHSALMTRRLQESLHYYSRIVCLHVCNLAAEHNHREPTGT